MVTGLGDNDAVGFKLHAWHTSAAVIGWRRAGSYDLHVYVRVDPWMEIDVGHETVTLRTSVEGDARKIVASVSSTVLDYN